MARSYENITYEVDDGVAIVALNRPERRNALSGQLLTELETALWDADELYDLRADPTESNNLWHDPQYKATITEMETQLYEMMDELGGMEIPLNAPRGNSQNKRLRSRGGNEAVDFPEAIVVDEPLNRNAQ